MKTLFITSQKQYEELISNKIGLRYVEEVVFDKFKIGVISVIEGINFCEEADVKWDIRTAK